MRVLVAEPDADLLDVLTFLLRRAGYDVSPARDGAAALRAWQQQAPQLFLLETALPHISGWEVCQTVRRTDTTPLIFLSSAAREADIVRGLDLGADDYVAKPFSPSQLLARLRAVRRRVATPATVSATAGAVIQVGDLILDPQWRVIRRGDGVIQLTGTEFKLLYELVLHEGQVLPHQMLTDRVWGYEGVDDASVLKGHIRNLRKKLEQDPAGPLLYVQTVVGVGYTFSASPLPNNAAHKSSSASEPGRFAALATR